MDSRRRLFLNGGEPNDTETSQDITSEELDNILTRHHTTQENIAEAMLSMISNLKKQTLTAENIIKSDCKQLPKVSDFVDRNKSEIETEHKKFQNKGNKLSTCQIFLMLLVVLIVFVYMVLFIRLNKK